MELDSRVNSPPEVNRATGYEFNTNVEINKTLREADEFTTKHDLGDFRNEIRKGLLLFHYPDDYTRIKEEIIYLEDGDEDLPSKNSISIEPKHIGLCVATSFLSLLASHPLPKWGWIWLMPKGVFWIDSPQDRTATVIAVILGFLASFILNRFWSRLQALRVGSILALGALLTTFVAQDHYSIYALDFTSAGMGLVLLSTLLLYISETNEHSVCGYFIGKVYIATAAITYIVESSGRVLTDDLNLNVPRDLVRLIFAIMAALTVFGLAFTVPDSPYWLALRGNIPGAYCSLRAFRATSDQAARDLFQIYDVISSKQNRTDRHTTRGPMSLRLNKLMLNWKRWAILLTGALLMFTRGVAGRYATYICLMAYLGSEVWMQMIEGAVSMVLCGLALKFLAPYFDRFRRRYMLIGLLSGMFICATLSKFTSVEGTGIPRNSTSIGFSAGFIVLHFLSEIPVALYISEGFPLSHRELGVTLTLSAYAAGTTAVKLYDILESLLILLPVTLFLMYLFMKETRGFPLERNSLMV